MTTKHTPGLGDDPILRAAYATLLWARTPGNHGGGNPYGQRHVADAERVVARHEGREPESWAGQEKAGAA
jgi:hypothetical protein